MHSMIGTTSSGLLLGLAISLLSEEELHHVTQYATYAAASGTSPDEVLDTLPKFEVPSIAPIICVSIVLSTAQLRGPIFKLQKAYSTAWKLLPESIKSGHGSEAAQQLVQHVWAQVRQSYSSLLDLLHSHSTKAALIDPESGLSISHSELARIVSKFKIALHHHDNEAKPIVAVSLPNGLLLALTLLATTAFYTTAPIAHGPGVSAEQLKADVLQSQSHVVVAEKRDVGRLGLCDKWLADANVQVVLIELSDGKRLILSDVNGKLLQDHDSTPQPNAADDTGVLLFTSGTSGTKKLIPPDVHSMVSGVTMVIDSWGLSPSMRCLNQMPLNHVGGIIRNLFAPIMSGGSVICCASFDANLFWDCVED